MYSQICKIASQYDNQDYTMRPRDDTLVIVKIAVRNSLKFGIFFLFYEPIWTFSEQPCEGFLNVCFRFSFSKVDSSRRNITLSGQRLMFEMFETLLLEFIVFL